jgi:hypothetical protein
MAKKPTDTVKYNLEIELKEAHVPILTDMMEMPEGVDASPSQKIRDMTEDVLTQIATGGVLFPPDDVKLVLDSTGVQLSNAEELIPYISDVAGMVDGKHRVTVLIDPANYPAYEELARTQERTVDALMQEVVDAVQENEWVYELHPRPHHVLMTEVAAERLAEILGAKFNTGTELADLIEKKLAPPAEEDASSLFEETASNVGRVE